ncbi:MAG: EAL domain-containing protein [Ahrensia sp.]|nr:EAL domain-containing protein [Ahrensia sp.]
MKIGTRQRALQQDQPSELAEDHDVAQQCEGEDLLETTMSVIAQGILIHDTDRIIRANQRMIELLDIPAELVERGRPWIDMVRFRAARGDYGDVDELKFAEETDRSKIGVPHSTRQTVGEREIQCEWRVKNGLVFTSFTDITSARIQERRLRNSQARIRRMAERDALTDLYNRRAFDHALEEAVRANLEAGDQADDLALLVFDLDRFKSINDGYGHSTGDVLLKAVAERISRVFRQTDHVARIGGDEFAAICKGCTRESAVAKARELIEIVNQPYTVNDIELSVGVSVGVSVFCAKTKSADELVTAADLALYAAKNDGRGTVAVFHKRMAEQASERLQLETDLRNAERNDELALFYQVQHDLKSSSEVGFEALMRWEHPKFGLLSPDRFIPLAEENGMIIELGRWALHRAASDFSAYDDTTRVAVNVSPAQFRGSDLVRDVYDALNASGLDPSRLEIEVTEQLLIDETEKTLATLNKLRDMGVTLSLDDFGSGYSSLSYLTQFPFSKLKIDRCFIARMLEDARSKSLVTSILALAESLGMKVTAEGVETGEQLAALTRFHCDEAQGYLLGRPAPLTSITGEDDRLINNAA